MPPISFVDSTAIQVFTEMITAWNKRGVTFRVANANGQARRRMVRELQAIMRQDEETFESTVEEIVNRWVVEAPISNSVMTIRKSYDVRSQSVPANVFNNQQSKKESDKLWTWSQLRRIYDSEHQRRSVRAMTST